MSEPFPHPDDAAHPRRRRRRRWPWVLLGVVLLLAGGCAALVIGIAHETDKTVKVVYEVTGDAKTVNIAYSTWRDGSLVTESASSQALPWRKELSTKGFVKGGLLAVTIGGGGGSATCEVTVGDDAPRTARATGADATATCTGF
ncbi:hypothetical protein [Streptomyces albireticuli]|uniref:MmpS family membrane protein n=1 Tax=Streptomyces albireticuli TaxID=1940 RepID=A0A2A2D6I0_9ACTN|nr:hypothetical protein [Streptomyces albireticuli]MCD9140548.1 hypothetical protein [Streptomyces albireticuli]MCD9161490.1 hypothetical protein [Streptomyces albireticuli]MCD9192940.1 hypothetical protein [Streptomyces albireticuli]PAU48088.1 hypothetical protein CK936_15265 [Streptomyces albireticuli]